MRKYYSLSLLTISIIFFSTGASAQWIFTPSPWGLGIYDRIIAIDSSVFLSNTDLIYQSTNDGQTWGVINNTITNPTWLSACDQILFAIGGDSGFVYHSMDYGVNWDSLCIGLPSYSIDIHGQLGGSAKNLFACPGLGLPGNPGFVFHSSDSGSHWAKRGMGLPSNDFTARLAFVGSVVIASTYYGGHGVFRSTDSGVTWRPVNTGLPASFGVYSLGSIGPVLLAGLSYGGGDGAIYRSTNKGDTWVQSSSGLSSYDTVMNFATRGTMVFAALDQGGVYYSNDSGQTWKASSWPNANPLARTIAVTNKYVFMGAYNGGLWRRPLSDFNNSDAVSSPSTSSLLSLAAYPSPATTRTTISFTLPAPGTASLTLTDAAGREWPLAAPSWFAAGEHEITWDASQYPSGVYLCRLIAGEKSVAKRIVVLK